MLMIKALAVITVETVCYYLISLMTYVAKTELYRCCRALLIVCTYVMCRSFPRSAVSNRWGKTALDIVLQI